jgi:hypothetical protein
MSSFTGRQLVQIIKLAGLESNTRSEIVELFAERGFVVSPGSAGRALSRARGSWSSDKIFGETDGIFYERGAKVGYLPLSTETYVNANGDLVGGGDILSDWEGKVGIPLADAFFLAQQGGIEWSARTRGAIERSLEYIYKNYGLVGQDALDDLGYRVNVMADQIEDTLLYEVSFVQVGGFDIDGAISQIYSL